MYAVGIAFAFITAQILNTFVFSKKETPFVMELPPYRMPTVRNILYHMWDKTRHYLKKIGTVILLGVIIIWALEYFPRETSKTGNYLAQIEAVGQQENVNNSQKENLITDIRQEMESDRLINSYLGRIGQWIEPVMRPLGFDWKMSISLVAGLPAKEIVVSTMGVLFQASDDESTVNLQNRLQNEIHIRGDKAGEKVFTLPTALAFLVFILLYFPCVGVVATIKNESESWKWAVFVVVYTTALAWIMAFVVYNIGNLFI
jgi:ferrous iron transport protein B